MIPCLLDLELTENEVTLGNMAIMSFIKNDTEDYFCGYKREYISPEFPMELFHQSLDWLNPVMDRIERLGFNTFITRELIDNNVIYSCAIVNDKTGEIKYWIDGKFKITTVWRTVVRFCSEYKFKLKTTNNA